MFAAFVQEETLWIAEIERRSLPGSNAAMTYRITYASLHQRCRLPPALKKRLLKSMNRVRERRFFGTLEGGEPSLRGIAVVHTEKQEI